MKKYSYVGISFIILVFGIWVVNELRQRYVHNDDLVVIGKAPQFSLTDQNGKIITPEAYQDRVYVVDFFFTTCPSICPVMTENLVDIQNTFYGYPDFGIASISIDPKFDTVEALKNYTEKYQIKHPNWHLLRGSKTEIEELANKGFNIFVEVGERTGNDIQHSGMFALIDKNGNIRSRKDEFGNPIIYYDGLSYEDENSLQFSRDGKHRPGIEMLKADIKKLLNE